ncbi:hypothetical protein SEA_LUNA18_58 [Microbacterium phage Luna18]|nr:hypothetical protein SEA_CHEPLI_58 [Microbacterium phage Chepli]QZE10345.1 hypothetical protein SEA_KATCHAN_57 [Microbacterium phage KatChan]URQ04908.1 hypothetical protein SEA_LUNA18_58 [Microbacterium phage Luna18]
MNLFRWLKKEPRRVASPATFRRMVAEERRRQVALGWTPEHDRQHGPLHLLALSQIYIRLGKPVQAAALNEAAMDLIRGNATQYIDIVFDKLTESQLIFVEVETPDGASMRFGTWVQREDGFSVLRVNYWDAIAALGIPGVNRG